MHFKLISHTLCPYVQRVSIMLTELELQFERVDIDLARKPSWFLAISPLGKVPVLAINDTQVLFESSVISHYVHEISDSPLFSSNTYEKHQQLAWVEFASQVLIDIARLYKAKNDVLLTGPIQDIESKFQVLENTIGPGPWFSGDKFGAVDAAFAPVFRYFNVINPLLERDLFANLPALQSWRSALEKRPSVQTAVAETYPHQLFTFLQGQDSILGEKAKSHSSL